MNALNPGQPVQQPLGPRFDLNANSGVVGLPQGVLASMATEETRPMGL
jgi:hypothetical protein